MPASASFLTDSRRVIDIVRAARHSSRSSISDLLTGEELIALNRHVQAQGEYIHRWDVVGTNLYRAWWMPVPPPHYRQLDLPLVKS